MECKKFVDLYSLELLSVNIVIGSVSIMTCLLDGKGRGSLGLVMSEIVRETCYAVYK